jgi:hypothetical protein
MVSFLPQGASGSVTGNAVRLSNANVKVNMVFGAQIPVSAGIRTPSKHDIEFNCALFVVKKEFKSKS